MQVTANMATIEDRKGLLPKVLRSIHEQFDIIRIYCNDYEPDRFLEDEFPNVKLHWGPNDYTDRAKFYWQRNDEYYFTIDDDIIYPEWYVKRTLDFLKENPDKIVTYHGRKLLGKGLHYYFGHEQLHFLMDVYENTTVDVPGTGVMAFDTRNVHLNIMGYDEDCMSDILAGLEAKKKGIDCICLAHEQRDFRTLPYARRSSIFMQHRNKCKKQIKYADKIISSMN